MGDEVGVFCLQINTKVFYQLIVSLCVCMYVCVFCVCMCVCTFIHHEAFICLDQLGYQGTDQQCYVEDIEFLCWFPSLLLWNAALTFQLAALSCLHTRSGQSHDLTSIRLTFRTQILHSPLTGVVFGTHYIVGQSGFASALTIYIGKARVTTNFIVEPSPRRSTQPSPSSFISISESIIFHFQRRSPPKNWRENDMTYLLREKMIYIDIGYKTATC